MRPIWIVLLAIGALLALAVAAELPALERYRKIKRM